MISIPNIINIIASLNINKLILPEILVAWLACLVLLIDLFISNKNKIITYLFTQLGLLTVIFTIYSNFQNLLNLPLTQEEQLLLINNGFILNARINLFKLIIASLMFLIFIYAKDYFKFKKYFSGEYFVLNLLSMLGFMILISSRNFFNFYFAVEMFSMPIYALIALESKPDNMEASLKYFILSAIFSGIFLYGLSLIYGATGSLDFQSIINFIATQHISMLFHVGIMLIFIGIFFKLNLSPFHMWSPDVYQGSTIIVTMLIATLPKIALVSVFSCLLMEVLPKYINYHWQVLLIIIAILSMLIGNIGAILQNNIKRLLAYSAIGHAGFIILGLAANNHQGAIAADFYVVLYAFMMVGIFGSIVIFNNKNIEFDNINNFSGLAKQHPWIAGMLLILLLSMAGVPPTAGFYAKFLIIKALITADLIWVAVVGLLFSVISLFYYLKIIKHMYFVDATQQQLQLKFSIKTKFNCSSIIALSTDAILILLLTVIFPYLELLHK